MFCNLLTAFAIVVGGCATPQALSDAPPKFDVTTAQTLINKHRAAHGLGPVAIDARLMKAARAHSADMARTGNADHTGSDGSLPKTRALRAGYPARYASENVASGYHETKDVIDGWESSSGHNANLLRATAKQMGMAMVYNPKVGEETYWTLVMGTPK